MIDKLNLQSNLSSLLETSHLKPFLYNSAISVAQYIALHRLRSLENEPDPIDKKKIIIHSVHGTYLSAIYKEGALAKALRLHGHDAKMLFCNKQLESCCALFTIDHPENKHDCSNCVKFSKQFCELLKIPRLVYQNFYLPYDRFDQMIRLRLGSETFDENTIYKGVNIGTHAKMGTERYFKGSSPDSSDYRERFLSKLVDASVVVDIAEQVLSKEKPDIIITSHSCYAEFGPFSDYFKNHNIPVFTWFTGYEPNTLVFDLPEIGKDFGRCLKIRNQRPLSPNELWELNVFIEKRKSGMGESKLYGFTSEEKKFNFSDGFSLVFCLFPNNPWDADPSCHTLFFESTLEWAFETIKFFKEYPTRFLIIKTHPSEKLYGSRKTIYDIINEKFPELPANILLLPPDTPISAYDLFRHLDVGIVSNTTTGLELLLEGIPVITVGEAHYRGKGLAYDPESRQEYFETLKKGSFVIKDEQKALLYAHYYFIKSFLPFRMFYKKSFLNIGFSFRSLDELRNSEEMNHIIDCITKGKLFQEW